MMIIVCVHRPGIIIINDRRQSIRFNGQTINTINLNSFHDTAN